MAGDTQREFGTQPIDRILADMGVENHELVAASPDQLTHKQVQRARKGRRLTANMQAKICRAVRALLEERGEDREASVDTLFNYRA